MIHLKWKQAWFSNRAEGKTNCGNSNFLCQRAIPVQQGQKVMYFPSSKNKINNYQKVHENVVMLQGCSFYS